MKEINNNDRKLPIPIKPLVIINNTNNVEKAGLNIERLKQACKNLSKHWRTKIRDFDAVSKQEFDIIAFHVGSLHNTEAYPMIYETILDIFRDHIRPDNIEAGTLSGYIGGCAIETHFSSMPGCGVYCAGNSVPIPNSPVGCQYPVMLASYSANVFTFHLLHDSTDRKYAIVYFYSPNKQVPYFSMEEKRALKQYQIEQVNIISYDKNSYKELNGGFVALDTLPTRGIDIQKNGLSLNISSTIEEETKITQAESDDRFNYKFLIVLFIFLILILLAGLVFWRYRKI